MSKKTNQTLFLKIPIGEAFLPVAVGFVDRAAKSLGLNEELAEELALATEEVFAYISRIGAEFDPDIEIHCTACSHFIKVDISLPVQNMQLRSFNMTAKVSAEDELGLDQMGLLIASRVTDRFRIGRKANGNLFLSLEKEFHYPEIDLSDLKEETRPISKYRIQAADAAKIKWFARLVNQQYSLSFFPKEFRYPGKLVDMAVAGDYHFLLAEGLAGEIGGGLAWKWEGHKTIEIFGPYIFNRENSTDMARDLIEAGISNVARTPALVLVNRMPTLQLPAGYLEALTVSAGHGADSSSGGTAAFFRLMNEDSGDAVWVHPQLAVWLEAEYHRLVFPREIRAVHSDGEAVEPFSVLSAEMDRESNWATLRPIWQGADAKENLAEHVSLLKGEGFASILFEMDLGVAWQGTFTPGLLELGFVPFMILPYAGSADIVVFRHEREHP